jgi:hypothetical protein
LSLLASPSSVQLTGRLFKLVALYKYTYMSLRICYAGSRLQKKNEVPTLYGQWKLFQGLRILICASWIFETKTTIMGLCRLQTSPLILLTERGIMWPGRNRIYGSWGLVHAKSPSLSTNQSVTHTYSGQGVSEREREMPAEWTRPLQGNKCAVG